MKRRSAFLAGGLVVSALFLTTLISCDELPGSEFDSLPFSALYAKQVNFRNILPSDIELSGIEVRTFRMGSKVYILIQSGNGGVGARAFVLLDENLELKKIQRESDWPSGGALFPSGSNWTVSGITGSGTYGKLFAVLVGNLNSGGETLTAIDESFTFLPLNTSTFNQAHFGAGEFMLRVGLNSPGTSAINILGGTTAVDQFSVGSPFLAVSSVSTIGGAIVDLSATNYYLDAGRNKGTNVFSIIRTPVIESGFANSGQSSAYSSPDIALFTAPSLVGGFYAFPVFWIVTGNWAATPIAALTNYTGGAPHSASAMDLDIGADEDLFDASSYYYQIKVEKEGFVVPYPSGKDRYVNFSGATTTTFNLKVGKNKKASNSFPRGYVSGYDHWFYLDQSSGVLYKLRGWWL